MLERIREKLFNKAVTLFGVNSKMAAVVQNNYEISDEDVQDIINDFEKQFDNKIMELKDWKIKSLNWLKAFQLYLNKKDK